MIQMKTVRKNYRLGKHAVLALDDINLEIHDGDFVSIVGSSGCGKSTLLLAMGGMLTPTGGEVLVNGQSLYGLSAEDRARVRREQFGFVFQTFNLIPYLTARENVEVPLYLAEIGEQGQKQKAEALLDRLGLAERMDHKPFELSVGQQQRVALARMLANDPKVILADEPTANLDPETAETVLGFLKDLNKEGRTVVLVTHSPEAAQVARRVVRLKEGRIESNGAPG
jgi:putative ABC transport system ATP-binding protein